MPGPWRVARGCTSGQLAVRVSGQVGRVEQAVGSWHVLQAVGAHGFLDGTLQALGLHCAQADFANFVGDHIGLQSKLQAAQL